MCEKEIFTLYQSNFIKTVKQKCVVRPAYHLTTSICTVEPLVIEVAVCIVAGAVHYVAMCGNRNQSKVLLSFMLQHGWDNEHHFIA